MEYARRITIDSVKNVASTDADTDEILAEPNASPAGHHRRSAALSSPSHQEIALPIAGAGVNRVHLADATEHGASIEHTLVEGASKRVRHHAAH
ncbi:hypothetical protein [Agrococcus sp. Marseille-Q4369]|uniref:hypothetical protein n=1 Tax=Agrococcus sp. Marseille-Q4369 TaxID=2810513 RepID=UPI001B8B88B9|nr:hypothetical protein [Agrococcus sp. Marseille-Q4369]QUW18217.1 hypothetical protein JSQ78_10320 [Agrococcus sp. Marseille-Q4369]